VIATTSTAQKAERLRALGASDVINYSETPDWDAKVRELTDGRGVDCIVEIGGPGTIAMSLLALAVGGHVSLIGASLSSSGTGLDPLLLTGRGITLGSIRVGSRTDFEAMNRAIALHRLRPAEGFGRHIARSLPWLDSAPSTAVATRSSGVTGVILAFLVACFPECSCPMIAAGSCTIVRSPETAAAILAWFTNKTIITDCT